MSSESDGEADVYTVEWDPELDAVVVEWHQSPSSASFRAGLTAARSLTERRSATKLLADCRGLGSFSEVPLEWMREEWHPRMVEAGFEHGAVVYPEDDRARFEVDRAAREDATAGFAFERVFIDDVEEARDWLRVQ